MTLQQIFLPFSFPLLSSPFPSLSLSLPSFLPVFLPPTHPPSLPISLLPSFPPFTPFTLSQGQKARISAIYFPLIPLVLDHVTRLDPGAKLYISPMLNATSMALFTSASGDGAKSPSVLDSMPSSATGSEYLQPHSQTFPSLIPRPSPASFPDLPSLIPRPSPASFPGLPQPHSQTFPSLIARTPNLIPIPSPDHPSFIPIPSPASFPGLPWFQFLITFVIPFHYVSWVCRALCTCVSIFCFLVPHLPALRSTDDRRGTMDKTSVSGLELTSIKSTHSKAPAPPSRCVIVWFPCQVAWE